MSDIDIPKGAHWPATLNSELAQAEAGIICVTHDNTESPWLLFEAGALARNFPDQARVCVLLIDLKPEELSGPLAHYQASRIEKEDAWRLLLSLNRIAGDHQLEAERLRRAFERYWPDLHDRLASLQDDDEVAGRVPNLLQEILVGVRDMQKDLADLRPDSEQFLSTKIVRDNVSIFGSEEVVGRIDSSGNVYIYDLEPEPIGKVKGKDRCFLSSACCVFMGLPDDCLELLTLRKFRDSFMSASPEGRLLIEIYYRISPGILKEVEASRNRDSIFRDIYSDLVLPSADSILSGRNQEALVHYRDYVLSLASSLGNNGERSASGRRITRLLQRTEKLALSGR